MVEISGSENHVDDIETVRGLIQGIAKAKKILNLYPPNNPIYTKTFEGIYSKIKDFLELNNELRLNILQNEIFYNNEQVYYNAEKEDNLALFFFKDGIREITFLRGLDETEFADFMKIINTDFENIAVEDDLVTLLWERDFDHIKYLVSEELLSDEDEEVFEKVKKNTYSDDNLTRAYHDGLKTSEQPTPTPVPVNDADLQHISEEIEKAETNPKIDKLLVILIELLYQTWEDKHFPEIVEYIKNLITYCVKNGDFQKASSILNQIKEIIEDENIDEDRIKTLKKIYTSINSNLFIQEIGRVLDTEISVEEKGFIEFARHFDKTSIPHLIKLLGELQRIKSRRLLMDALSIVGRFDVKRLGEALNDKWYVARNIVIVLGKIGDSWSREFLLKALSHNDQRVRKEAIKAIANIEGADIIPHLRTALNDADPSIRITAVRTLGNLKTESAKKILLEEVSRKDFIEREFSEKKEFYDAISRWHDKEVKDFLFKTLKKKRLWKKTKNDETRACAAYALGILGDKDAIPLLEKTKNSKNKLLKLFSTTAINQLIG